MFCLHQNKLCFISKFSETWTQPWLFVYMSFLFLLWFHNPDFSYWKVSSRWQIVNHCEKRWLPLCCSVKCFNHGNFVCPSSRVIREERMRDVKKSPTSPCTTEKTRFLELLDDGIVEETTIENDHCHVSRKPAVVRHNAERQNLADKQPE